VGPFQACHVRDELAMRQEARSFEEPRQFLAQFAQAVARGRLREQILLRQVLPVRLTQHAGNSRKILEQCFGVANGAIAAQCSERGTDAVRRS
jgi:hypothetical protein